MANPAVPRWLRFEHRPEWMAAAVMYPHIFQGWSLFAPDAPLSDETVYVDAVTRDGRHVDPYNEVGSRVATLPVEQVPVRLGHDSFWCDFTLRIPDGGVYHQAFIEWILRYPERTGQPEDTIVRFEAFSLWQDSPQPGDERADQHPQAALPAMAVSDSDPPVAPPPADAPRRRPLTRRRARGRAAAADAACRRAVARGRAHRGCPGARQARRWAAFRRRFADLYLTVDARSLGFGRIVLAVVLLVDLVRRVPRHHALLFERRAGAEPHDAVAAAHAVDVLVLLHPVAARRGGGRLRASAASSTSALLVGWRTRLMQVLALICVLSLHGRVTLMENGGDWMLGELALWTAFLPLGRRFSVDAVRESLRRAPRDDRGRARRSRGARARREGNRIVTLAVLGAGRCSSRTPTSSTRSTRGDRPGGRGPRSTTCCTRIGWSPGSPSGCART